MRFAVHPEPGAISDHEHVMSQSNGGEWLVTWHTPSNPPDGKEHGALAICFDENEMIALISRDGQNWGFPGGRPEGAESWEETMVREVEEETCATVVTE